MALEDWNQYGATSNATLNTDTFNEGNASLELSGDSTLAVIYGQTETENPTEGQIVTDLQHGDSFALLFRFQDTQNFYVLNLDYIEFLYWQAYYVQNGNTNLLDNGGDDPNSGTSWIKYRFTCWEDANNDLRFRVEYSDDGGSTWTQIGSDIVHGDPLFNSGGGIGVGKVTDVTEPGTSYVDQTELYY